MNNNHLDRIQKALTYYFKTKRLPNGVIRLSHGANFSKAGSIFAFFLTLFFILISIVYIIHGYYVFCVISLPICTLLIAYILNLEGIEIDTNDGKIRNYKSFLGVRSGDWMDIKNFNQLRICQDSILERRRIDRGSTYSSFRSFDNHKFYTLYLVDMSEKHFIKLNEDESVTRVRVLANKFSQLSKVPLNENIMIQKAEVVGRWRAF
mgnify:CR=1 FL=1